jgi:alpha-maltose-1-phosphate synthase
LGGYLEDRKLPVVLLPKEIHHMQKSVAININLSTSGSRLGGAALAAEFHSVYMADIFPVELWRMWDKDETLHLRNLKITNFSSRSKLDVIDKFLPRKVRSFLLDCDMRDKLNQERPSIVHLHNPLPSLAFAGITNWAFKSGIKTVASTHGFYEVMHPNFGFSRLESFLWKQGVSKPVFNAIKSLDAICSLYPDEKNMLIDLGIPAEKIFLTPNGVNPFFLTDPSPSELDTIINKFNLVLDNPMMLFIGNHTGNKGLDTVMKVASQISFPATVVVGGRLSCPDEPERWKQRFPPSSGVRVVFTDYLTTSEQRSLYHLAQVLLYPSTADTLPLTIIEAMACNLPVIAYDVGGISYQLKDGCGVVVEAGNFDLFLSRLERIIADSELRNKISKKAKDRQKEVFAWEKAAAVTVDLYKSLIE